MSDKEPIFRFKPRPSVDIRVGDCLELLTGIPDESIDCCVTSPPYFNLRDYQTGEQQIGLEPTPAEFVAKLVAVFEEVRRVLKPTGSLWLNIGDSYANDSKWGGASGGKHARSLHGATSIGRNRARTGLKGKDLIGIPWMIAFALRDAGWYLRSDVIWHKPNPLPEPVRDRPSCAHEHVFLLAKNQQYFYDAAAISEPSVMKPQRRLTAKAKYQAPGGAHTGGTHGLLRSESGVDGGPTRNARNVWVICPKPYKGAHFATMPPELAAKCISAGSSEHGCCERCGAPWRRLTARVAQDYDGSRYGLRARLGTTVEGMISGTAASTLGSSGGQLTAQRLTTGWEASCDCADAATIPCTVLDPFGGAGTSALVARRLGRQSVLLELNPAYAELARERLAAEQD